MRYNNDTMQRLIVASSNKGKIKEIRMLADDRFDVVSMKDAGIDVDVEENGSTFEENALIKAKAIYELCHAPVISDDSGLMVDALGGEPGVYSARYAGSGHDDAANNAKLLENLRGKSDRSARFCSAVVYYDGNRTEIAKGYVEGKIADSPRGANGFGYDPLFIADELGKTFGEATDEEKNAISHRARALRALFKLI